MTAEFQEILSHLGSIIYNPDTPEKDRVFAQALKYILVETNRIQMGSHLTYLG